MMLDSESYDVVVLGSGLAGSTVALCLARTGLSVLVVERSSHPRFAIGESMVPTTTLGADHLARRYRIPELADLFAYPELRRLGCAGWPKQHFWFGHHSEGAPLRRSDQVMFESLTLPRGPDVHLLRADSDAHLVSLFPKYGVDYLDRSALERFETTATRAELTLAGEGGGRRVEAKLVVDATGHGSTLARQFGLRDEKPRLETDTRAIFGHFRGVPALEGVLGGPDPGFRYSRDGGTIHHAFAGGWIWVIRFDNDVTSVGLVLDRRAHPLPAELSAEEEIQRILRRFPTIGAHLSSMEPIRPLVRTDRIQFSSRSILGEGFVLTPHAATFVDALFSSGALMTVAFAMRFVPLARDLLRRPDYSLALAADALRPLDAAFLRETRQVDRVVDGMLGSFRSFEAMKQFFRVWAVSSYLQQATWVGGRMDRAGASGLLYGAGVPSWRATVARMHRAVRTAAGSGDELADTLKAIMDALPPEDARAFPRRSEAPCVVRALDRPYVRRWVDHARGESPELEAELRAWRFWRYGLGTAARSLGLGAREGLSRAVGGGLHPGVDAVRRLRSGAVPRPGAR